MPAPGSVTEVFRTFLRLGLSSFGGPVAHLGYFRSDIVARRQWVDEASYADIVALCQFLPGPASSQVGVSLGIIRAGLPGGVAAWLGFTLPSAVAMILFAYGIAWFGDVQHAAWLHGLKIVAVSVVAQAVWGMGRSLCPDRPRVTLAVVAALLTLGVPGIAGQIGAILIGALLGRWVMPAAPPTVVGALGLKLNRRIAVAALLGFMALLGGLPFLAASSDSHALHMFERFYLAGALVFGGGHVVLPLLQQAVVPPGWIGNDGFLAGYGAVQAMPGPLFTFAAYLGAAMQPSPSGWAGGLLCLLAIYLPSFLLLIGVLPFWDVLRKQAAVRAAFGGVNAAVVGILLAALYTPVWTGAIDGAGDFALGLVAFLLLAFWKIPPWQVVILGAAASSALASV